LVDALPDGGAETMSQDDITSPDQPLGTESFEQGDEALDEASRIDPDFVEAVEQDPALNPALQVDDRELEEAGLKLDDPESLASLDGGIDDPDGIGEPTGRVDPRGGDDEGWDLDAPAAGGNETDEEFDERSN
jgi:hypothetical protein